jgi:hypothetical protein
MIFLNVIHKSTVYKGILSCNFVDLGGLVVSVFATGPKVRGFHPDRG